MNSYKNIPLWKNARRQRVLEEFRNNVFSYFNNSSALRIGEGRTEKTEEGVQARQRINLTAIQAHDIIITAGIAPTATWTYPNLSLLEVLRVGVPRLRLGNDRGDAVRGILPPYSAARMVR